MVIARGDWNCSRSSPAVATWAASVIVDPLAQTRACSVITRPEETHPHPFQVRRDVHEAADRGRVDGVIVRVDTDVVVASEPDATPPTQLQRDRGQGQHRGPVSIETIQRPHFDRPHDPGVRQLKPVTELGVEVRRRGERATRHEGGFEPAVAAFDDPFRFRVAGLE